MQGQLLFWTGSTLTWEELQDLHLLHHLQQPLLPQNLVVLTIGLRMDIVMMKIIMLNANLMVEIVATTAWKTGTFIAVIVHVSLEMPPLVRLECHTGLEMISA